MTSNPKSSATATGGQEIVILLAARVITLATDLVSQSMLAYLLLPEGRGAYAICVLFGVLSGIFFTPGADRGTQYLVMSKQASVSHVIVIAFAICMGGSALATLPAVLLIHSGFPFFDNADTRSLYLALVLIPLTSFAAAAQLQLAGLRRFVHLAFFISLRSGTVALGIIAFVWWLGLGVDGAIIALAIGHVILTSACLWELRRHYDLVVAKPASSQFLQVIVYGLKDHVARIMQMIDFRLGSLLLGVVSGRAEIGYFSTASALISRVQIIPHVVGTISLPRVVADDTGRPQLVAFCVRISWFTVGAVLLVLLLISPSLVSLLFSEAFLPAIPLIWIMSLGVLVHSGAEIFVAYFRGVNRPQTSSWATSLGLSTNVVAFFALFPQLGVAGAAWAMTIGLLVRSTYLWVMFHKISRMPWTSTWLPQRGDAAFLWTSGKLLVARVTNR